MGVRRLLSLVHGLSPSSALARSVQRPSRRPMRPVIAESRGATKDEIGAFMQRTKAVR